MLKNEMDKQASLSHEEACQAIMAKIDIFLFPAGGTKEEYLWKL